MEFMDYRHRPINELISFGKLYEAVGEDVRVTGIHSIFVPVGEPQSLDECFDYYWKTINYKTNEHEALLCKVAESIAFYDSIHVRLIYEKDGREFDYCLTDKELVI